MTPTTVLVTVQRSVVVFEIFGEEVREGGSVARLQDAVDDRCQPTFTTSGLAVSLCNMDAAVACAIQAGFTVRWAVGSDRIQ
jgi:hypothetical protein